MMSWQKKGDKYAVLANGVARGDSLSGVAAINYMKSVAAGVGRPMQEIDVDKVRVEMANKYMEVLLKKISKGPIVGQVSQKEVAAFHKETFESLEYPERAWTLSPVFDVIAVENREDYWRHVLSSAGNLTDEFTLSFHTHRMMAMASVVSSAENRLIAKEWISRVESPTGVPDLISAAAASLFNSINNAFKAASHFDNATDQTLQIEITPTTESRRDLQGQDDIRNDVSNGYVDRRLTHSIAFTDSTLDNTDFTSAQLGSLATGGVRPGEC